MKISGSSLLCLHKLDSFAATVNCSLCKTPRYRVSWDGAGPSQVLCRTKAPLALGKVLALLTCSCLVMDTMLLSSAASETDACTSIHHDKTDVNVAEQVLPGSQLLASADEQGNIAVKDLRMLGGSSQHAPWPRASPTKAPPAPTRSSATAAPPAGSSHAWYHAGKLLCLILLAPFMPFVK